MKSNSAMGMICMFLHSLCYIGMQLANKIIVEEGVFHKLQVFLLFHIFGVILLLLIYLGIYFHSHYKGNTFSFKCNHIYYHISRAFSSILSQVLLIYAYSKLPFVQVTSITVSYPIFAVIAGVVFLGSSMGVIRWMSAVVGLIGALIIVGPGPESFDYYTIFVMLSVLLWVLFDMLTVKLGRKEDLKSEFFHLFVFQFLFAAVLSTGIDLPERLFEHVFYKPDKLVFWFIMGAVSLLNVLSVLWAYRCAELVVVVPVYFLNLVIGALISRYVFYEELTQRVVIGSIFILCSVTMIAVRELKEKKIREKQIRGRFGAM